MRDLARHELLALEDCERPARAEPRGDLSVPKHRAVNGRSVCNRERANLHREPAYRRRWPGSGGRVLVGPATLSTGSVDKPVHLALASFDVGAHVLFGLFSHRAGLI